MKLQILGIITAIAFLSCEASRHHNTTHVITNKGTSSIAIGDVPIIAEILKQYVNSSSRDYSLLYIVDASQDIIERIASSHQLKSIQTELKSLPIGVSDGKNKIAISFSLSYNTSKRICTVYMEDSREPGDTAVWKYVLKKIPGKGWKVIQKSLAFVT